MSRHRMSDQEWRCEMQRRYPPATFLEAPLAWLRLWIADWCLGNEAQLHYPLSRRAPIRFRQLGKRELVAPKHIVSPSIAVSRMSAYVDFGPVRITWLQDASKPIPAHKMTLADLRKG
jgi:hypothetical protein